METQTKRPTIFAVSSARGTLPWSNPANAVTADGVPATVHTNASGLAISHWLLMTGFGFALGGDILDFDLFARRKIDVAVPGQAVFSDAYLIEGGVITQSLGAAGHYTTSYVTENGLLMPTGITGESCSEPDWGIAFSVQYENGDGVTDVTAAIDDLYVTLTATAAREPKFPGGGTFQRADNTGTFSRADMTGTFVKVN